MKNETSTHEGFTLPLPVYIDIEPVFVRTSDRDRFALMTLGQTLTAITRQLYDLGWPREEIDAAADQYWRAATSGDAGHVIRTTYLWVHADDDEPCDLEDSYNQRETP